MRGSGAERLAGWEFVTSSARGKRAVACEVPLKLETDVAVEMNLEEGLVGWATAGVVGE